MEGKLGKIFLAFFSRLELWITLGEEEGDEDTFLSIYIFSCI